MPTFSTSTLTAQSLSCWRDERCLFENLSFELRNGQALQISGENGSGKSSLLRILAGLLTPTEGEVLFNESAILEDRSSYYAQLSYLGHLPGIKAGLTPIENCSLTTQADKKHIAAILKELKLQEYGDVLCQQLSAGQQRRVALARLLLQQRAIWLLDEPLTALDVAGRELWQSSMQQHLQAGGMIIFSTHQTLDLSTIEVKTITLLNESPF